MDYLLRVLSPNSCIIFMRVKMMQVSQKWVHVDFWAENFWAFVLKISTRCIIFEKKAYFQNKHIRFSNVSHFDLGYSEFMMCLKINVFASEGNIQKMSSKYIEKKICDSTLHKTPESEKKLSKLNIFGDFTLLGDWFWVLGEEEKHCSVRTRQSRC